MKKPLLDAPKRLQRMLLQLQRYDIDLIYKLGKEMFLADTLSRAFSPSAKYGEQDELEKELEVVCALEDTQLQDMILDKNAQETRTDPTLRAVKELIQHGWPHQRQLVPEQARSYCNVKEDLTIENDIIMKNSRCVIPAAMRRDMLHRLHDAHMGVEATLRLACQTVFWPGINSQIRDFISACDTCLTYQPSLPKEPMQAHEVPLQPWTKLGADLFSFNSRTYLITVDYFSNFWEIDCLQQDTHCYTVINKLKAHFARHGIPKQLITDNGPQFASQDFANFAKEWKFQHTTSSPYHPQSNGKAEAAVKQAKQLMRKAKHSNTDGWLTILNYRATPQQDTNISPAQCFFGRCSRTRLPQDPSTTPNHPDLGSAEDIPQLQRQVRQKKCYDRNAHPLPSLSKGDPVRVQMQDKWIPAIVKVLSNRSYAIQTADGAKYIRNRRRLRYTPYDQRKISVDDYTQLPSASEDEHNTLEDNTPAVADNVQQRTCQPGPPANTENPPQEFQDIEPQQGQTVTRSGRVSRPPKRYQDKGFVFF